MVKRLTKQQFINKACMIHGDKYDYQDVVYTNNLKKVKIYCKKCKKFFLQSPANHLAGRGCPICGVNNQKRTLNEFICKCKQIHGNAYDYSQVVYINNTTPVKIICKVCGTIFEQLPKVHLKGCGCKKCKTKEHSKKHSLKIEEFIKRAKSVHKDKYCYDCVVLHGLKNKVKIFCKSCNEYFYQYPGDHLRGIGCPKCGRILASSKTRKSKEIFIEESINIHKHLYSYDQVEYKNAHSKVKIFCNRCKTFFFQTPHSHLKGLGCPNCNCSSNELKIEQILKQNNISFCIQKRFEDCRDQKPLPFDFYLTEYNMCIEYQGEQHFIPIKRTKSDTNEDTEKNLNYIKHHDLIKKMYCKDNRIDFFEIMYYEDVDERMNKLLSSLKENHNGKD